jgi:4-hydroxybenzoate polyprenyltransferase
LLTSFTEQRIQQRFRASSREHPTVTAATGERRQVIPLEASENPQQEGTENPVARLLKGLLYSSLYSGIFVGAMCSAAMFLLRLPFNPALPFICFSGCMLIYSMNRRTDLLEDSINLPERSRFTHRYGGYLLYTSMVLFGASLLLSISIGVRILAIALLPQVMGVLYSQFRLKRVFIVKNLTVALALTFPVLIVVATEWPVQMYWILLWGIVFIALFINTVIFDIKDVGGDAVHGIQTIPLRLGVRSTRIFCYVLLAIAALLTVALLSFDPIFLALFPFFAYIGIYTAAAPARNAPWWYYGIFVDGEMLFFLAVILLIQ